MLVLWDDYWGIWDYHSCCSRRWHRSLNLLPAAVGHVDGVVADHWLFLKWTEMGGGCRWGGGSLGVLLYLLVQTVKDVPKAGLRLERSFNLVTEMGYLYKWLLSQLHLESETCIVGMY